MKYWHCEILWKGEEIRLLNLPTLGINELGNMRNEKNFTFLVDFKMTFMKEMCLDSNENNKAETFWNLGLIC